MGLQMCRFRKHSSQLLKRLQLPYEESLSVVRLTSIQADLQVSVQSWMGTGIIKVKQRTHRSTLKEIVIVDERMLPHIICIYQHDFLCFLAGHWNI